MIHSMKRWLAAALSLTFVVTMSAQQVDYSVVAVPEEAGNDFIRITTDADCVCLPQVKRTRERIDWFSNRILDITPGGDYIAYLSARNNTTNIFIKDLNKQGGSTQRTNRTAVVDFTFSPDGRWVLFVGSSRIVSGNINYLNTDLYVARLDGTEMTQLTYHAADDLSPVWSQDGKYIYFISQRGSATGVANVWKMTFNY